jgi:hypothetical protein
MLYILNRKTVIAVFGISIVFTALLLTFINVNRSSSQTVANDCSALSMNVTNYDGTVPSTMLSGVVNVSINLPSTPQVNDITIFANDKPIGLAKPSTSSTNKWLFEWATSMWPNHTTAILKAKVVYSDHYCMVANTTPNYYYISYDQTQATSLKVTAQPSSWEGYTNSNQLITVASSILPAPSPSSPLQDVSQYSIYKWSLYNAIGNLFNVTNTYLSNTQKTYSSGQIAGTNVITVNVVYGGAETPITIPITVKPLTTDIPYTTTPTTTTTSTSTDTTNTTTTTTPTTTSTNITTATQVTSSQVQVSTITKSCVETEITTERYTAINSGASRPTAEELTKIANCFATSKYILPSNFSPIDPLQINSLAIQGTASVNKPENVTKKDDSGDRLTLKITGKAKPKSIVVVYIYSDPLVITTSTDSDGNWQYTLEDPLEPGTHEIYAVVNKGDGTYERSNPMSFFISTVGASAVNPKGLSLTLGEMPTASPAQSKNSLIYYVAGSAVVIIVALVGLFVTVISRKKHFAETTVVNNESTQPELNDLGVNSDINNSNKDKVAEEKEEDTPLITETNENPTESYPDKLQQDEQYEQTFDNFTDTDAEARELLNIKLADTDSPAKNDNDNNSSEQKE